MRPNNYLKDIVIASKKHLEKASEDEDQIVLENLFLRQMKEALPTAHFQKTRNPFYEEDLFSFEATNSSGLVINSYNMQKMDKVRKNLLKMINSLGWSYKNCSLSISPVNRSSAIISVLFYN